MIKFFLLLTLPLVAQDLTISPLGKGSIKAYTGRDLKGYQVVNLTICSPSETMVVSGGDLISVLVEHKLSVKSNVASVTQAVNGAVKRSFWYLVLDGGQYLSIILPELQAANILRWGAQAATSLLMAHQLADAAAPKIQARVADPTPLLRKLIDPTASYTVPLHGTGCLEGFLVAKYDKKVAYEGFTAHLGAAPTSTPIRAIIGQNPMNTPPQLPTKPEGVQQVAQLTDPTLGPGLLGY